MRSDEMTDPVQLRGARPDDTEALLHLWTGLVTYHRTLERVRPSRWSGPVEETLRPLLAQVWAAPDRYALFIAEVAGDRIGFVRVSLADDGPCPARIDTLFVADAFRGKRVGFRLLERACAWCRERDATEVCVEFIAPNDLAREFYEHAGFLPLLSTFMRRL